MLGEREIEKKILIGGTCPGTAASSPSTDYASTPQTQVTSTGSQAIRLSHEASQMACPKTCSYRAAVGLGNKYVRLNVGGTLFYTTLQVLTRQDSVLKAMFSGRKEVFIDREGWILIDRSGKHFGSILTYLREEAVTWQAGGL
ncbi:hypothetical protein J4Q44_G00325150 [Coregonus suidteri]|uniref:Potassium channel tetramerisation-type BTB domain-containing protein n=1 Tax=Coregonus suidteri TaxID=861788 RepID=A0AAN8QH37_9TELE